MRVSLIAAVAENGVIGRNNALPWHIKDDMRFFIQKTLGHHVIMGRRNYEAMGKPLPRRPNVVIRAALSRAAVTFEQSARW